MAQAPLPKIFLTHSWRNIEFARRLYSDLRAQGFELWFDDKTLKAGHRLAQEVNRALVWCDVYIPIISRAALASEWCWEEINAAISLSMQPGRNKRPRIITVLVEDCASELPPSLAARLYVNFTNRYDDGFAELLDKGFELRAYPPRQPTTLPRFVIGVEIAAIALLALCGGILVWTLLSSGTTWQGIPWLVPDRAAATRAARIGMSETQVAIESKTLTIRATAPAPTTIVAESTLTVPTPTPRPTYTPFPTYTPLPTYTPMSSPTSVPTVTPLPTPFGQLFDFETLGTWQIGETQFATLTQSDEQRHSGYYSGKLAYDFPAVRDENVTFQQKHAIASDHNALTAWVYGDGSNHFLNAWVVDSQGTKWSFTFGQVAHKGWKQMTAKFDLLRGWPNVAIDPPDRKEIAFPIALFDSLVLDAVPHEKASRGVIYIDNLYSFARPPTQGACDITAPPNAATVKDSVSVVGTATSNEFDHWEIDHRPAWVNFWLAPFVLPRSREQIQGNELMRWNTRTVGNGDYYLRLIVYTTDGLAICQQTILLKIRN